MLGICFRIQFFVLIAWSLISLLYGQYTPPPGSPLANHEHPRLYFTDSKLQDIKNYINNYEQSDFQTYINAVDGAYNISPSSKDRNLLLFDAMNFAFLSYAVHSGYFTNYNFGYSASQYAQKAYDHVVVIDSYNLTEKHNNATLSSKNDGGYVNLSVAVVYDWCFNYLSLSEKQLIANFFIRYWNNRDPDVNPGHHSKLDNNVTAYSHSAGVGGITVWGDDLGSPINNIIDDILDAIKWLWYDRYLLAGNQIFENTFGWGEGPSYIRFSLTNIHFFMTALSTAIDINLYNEYEWLHDIGVYVYNYLEPMKLSGAAENGYFMQRNDTGSLEDWDHVETLQMVTPVAYMLKNVDPDYAGFIRWVFETGPYRIINNAYQNKDPRNYWLFFKFLWGLKDIPVKTPEQAGIKKSYRFGLGEVILRSDFDTQDVTKLNLFTPGYFTPSHASWDHGGFYIWKYGNLTTQAGNGKSGADFPRVNEGGDPVYYNVLATYPSGRTTYLPPDLGIDDDADAYNDPANQPGGKNDMGDVLAMDFREDLFDFVDYDYTLSYKDVNYVNRAKRKYLYIRDPNAPNYSDQEYLLIFDDVSVSNQSVKRRWLIHPPYRPELKDGSWTQNGAGHWTSSNASLVEISNTYANAHGRLYIKVLEPANYKFILRGGSDGSNHYWFQDAEGNNLAESGYNEYYTDWAAFWVSSYRLEIEDQASSNTSQFFMVMQIGDANTLSNMFNVDKIDAGTFIGALINQDRISFFNKTTFPESTINYSFSSNKNVWHIITGLQQGLYYVRLDGNLITGLNTIVDENGVLFFQYTGGGNFVVSKSNDTNAPQTPQGLLIKP